ncbi:hypothetical protein Patl1_10138 [Pistacia atlantica]|uniref:Uncharacterized protein n=1 Tax=Pistacia atlantica TaxID=434234 RepID=A0ACC1A6C2_9ROSI|nr:hypothetical protein Patl1_10138 [Pistacia atlantica]
MREIRERKRYLLVLDDVWSEDEEEWDRLKCVLACGSKGASIIVTTRSRKVAFIMGTLPMHHLSGLSEDECWLLFKERAFGQETEERANLVAIGKEIVKKCSGVPLAVKSLGSLMRYKIWGFSCDISTLISLRVLRMREIGVWLSSSIRHLKHLRYLDLSHSRIELLPKLLCSLLNLQTLNLNQCRQLRKLPRRMRCLKNLRHLYLNGCTKLSQMPPHIGQITCLKTLTLFIVGERRGCHLAELKGLNLGEELRVTHLNRVGNLMDAQEANLVKKPNLRRLELSWKLDSESESQEKVEKVFEALQPHSNLEILEIQGYKGAKFPVWMEYQILSNVVSITLSDCKNCRQLPPLWQLPRLRYLTIKNLKNLKYIDTSFQSERKFPSLEELIIRRCLRLQRLSRQDGSELFPCLTKLEIYNCPKLTLPCLPSAKSLVIHSGNGELLKSISHFRSLTYLDLDTNCDLVYLPHGILQNLSSLCEMSITSFKKLKGVATDRVSLSCLKSLTIYECPKLEAFLEQVLEGLNSLQHLTLKMCIKFSNLSEGLRHLSALKSLTLNSCPELVTFPNSVKYLSSLRELTMCGICDLVFWTERGKEHLNCPKLTVLPESMRYEELVILQECREGMNC